MKNQIDLNSIPEKVREKFTLPEGVLIMRLYELAATKWGNKYMQHKPWEPFITPCKALMDDEFVSPTVINEFRRLIKRGYVPFLATSAGKVSKGAKKPVCRYTFNKAAFDAFCALPACPLQPEQQQKKSPADHPEKPRLPELVTYKEMKKMVEQSKLFNELKVLSDFLGDRVTGQLLHNTALYYRKDVERLIKHSQGLCQIVILPQQFPSTTEAKGE